jgi:DNA-directed RNA polymerase specialized sigma24 family protein
MYREYGRLVYAVAYRVLGRGDLAEEATQATFVKAWQASGRIDIDRDPAAWFATIARRTAIDLHRREGRRPASGLDQLARNDLAVVTLPPDPEALEAVRNDESPPGAVAERAIRQSVTDCRRRSRRWFWSGRCKAGRGR